MSETKARIISGLSIAFIYIICLNIDHFWFIYHFLFFIFGAVIQVLTLNEFYNLYHKSTTIKPHKIIGLTSSLVIYALFYLQLLKELQKKANPIMPLISDIIRFLETPLQWITFVLLFLVFSSFIIQVLGQQIKSSLAITSITIIGILYISIPIAHINLFFESKNGVFYVWLLSFITIISDSMSYFMGKYLGKHKINFSISPNKTYEGYVGGLISMLIVLHLFYLIFQYYANPPKISFLKLTLIGFLMFIATALGDLIESTIKRNLKVKDSGKMITGHGGLLDLTDGMIFTIPLFYYCYVILENGS